MSCADVLTFDYVHWPRLNASDGRPPLPYEPDPHFHGHEPAPPPVMAFPPVVERVASPPRGPPAGDGGGAPFIPPMPYEPGVGIAVGVGGGGVSPPPIQLMTHDRAPPEGEGVFIPPMPYEPERSPKLHGHGHPGEFPLDRGDVGPVPYDPAMGIPPPFPDPLYGVATVSSSPPHYLPYLRNLRNLHNLHNLHTFCAFQEQYL